MPTALTFKALAASVTERLAGAVTTRFAKGEKDFLITAPEAPYACTFRLVDRTDGVAVYAEARHEPSKDLINIAAARHGFLLKKGGRYQIYLQSNATPESIKETIDAFRAAFRDVVTSDIRLKQSIEEANAAVLARIRAELAGTGRALKVAFVVNDNTKWNSDSLVASIDQNPNMIFRIFLAPSGREKTHERKLVSYLIDRDFFLRIDSGLIDLWDRDQDTMNTSILKEYDVVFYQQPWGLSKITREMVGNSLAVNMHYGYAVHTNSKMLYRKRDFHPYIWRFFSQSETQKGIHEEQNPLSSGRHVVTGYPKLDVYHDARTPEFDWPGRGAKRVIYAPHHSLALEELKISTFDWTYDLLLEKAVAHRDISWAYKPHGRLKYVVQKNGVMSKKAYGDYVNQWATMGNSMVYDQGDYFDLFRTSDFMITDCSSFLGEYYPTGKPIIWLVSDRTKLKLNAVGEALAQTFYPVRSREEFHEVFDAVVVRGEDPHKSARDEVIRTHFDAESAATRVIRFLEDAFWAPS